MILQFPFEIHWKFFFETALILEVEAINDESGLESRVLGLGECHGVLRQVDQYFSSFFAIKAQIWWFFKVEHAGGSAKLCKINKYGKKAIYNLLF